MGGHGSWEPGFGSRFVRFKHYLYVSSCMGRILWTFKQCDDGRWFSLRRMNNTKTKHKRRFDPHVKMIPAPSNA